MYDIILYFKEKELMFLGSFGERCELGLTFGNDCPSLTQPNDLDQLTIYKNSLDATLNELESWLICMCECMMMSVGMKRVQIGLEKLDSHLQTSLPMSSRKFT
ncbi:hypothetical protein YC2023_035763 [Brassica napus]